MFDSPFWANALMNALMRTLMRALMRTLANPSAYLQGETRRCG
jgi:hypothetical protein